MRKQIFVPNEYYHIYNRGVDKRDIFLNKDDLFRFTESMKEFNQKDGVGSIRDVRKRKLEPGRGTKSLKRIEPLVSIVAYCLNPNHFHFILKQCADSGISDFMRKLQSGYTYYFNVKNSRSGALFQGTFKAHHISEEGYFGKIIGYVNKNYEIHTIPKNRSHLVLASDVEYENNKFKLVDSKEGPRILKEFGGVKAFKKHCAEIVDIIREERGKAPLSEEDELPSM